MTSDRIASSLASAGVADHMGIALAETRILGRIEPGVHARENGEFSRRRQSQFAFRAEGSRIPAICSEDFVKNCHETPPSSICFSTPDGALVDTQTYGSVSVVAVLLGGGLARLGVGDSM